MQQTQQRIVTAIIALAIFVSALVFLPNNGFRLFMALVAMGLSYEWYGVIDKNYRVIGMVATAILIALAHFLPSSAPIIVSSAVIIWIILLMGLNVNINVPSIFHKIVGPIIIAATWSALTQIKDLGLSYVLHVFLYVWVADASAYFFGRRFGKNKLAPNISPGKTREGLYGALGTAVIITYLYALYFGIIPWNQVLVAFFGGVFLIVLSVLGDLYQSQQKRLAGVKDSGNILPGHGGFWDRLDSLLPLSVFYLCMTQWF